MQATPGIDGQDPGIGAWIAAAIQFLLGITWVAYVYYLPGLLEQVGIEQTWLIAFLLVDQAVFGLADWTVGWLGERTERYWARLGRWIVAGSVLSSAAMLLLPWVARLGSPALLVATTFVWITASSAMRAPVVAMLGRTARPAAKLSLVATLLAGGALASAMAPWVANGLKRLSPELALAAGAAALVIASLAVVRFAAPGTLGAAQVTHADPRRLRWGALIAIAAVALGFATSVQLHAFIASAPLFRRLGAIDLSRWLPLFWLGFALASLAIGLHGRARARTGRDIVQPSGFAIMSIGAAFVGMAAVATTRIAPSLTSLALAQFVAGAAWAVLIDALFVRALELASPHRPTAAAGTLFATMAFAAVLRLALVAAIGAQDAARLGIWPIIGLWLVASAGVLVIRRASGANLRSAAT
ncbi:MAG: hypothetical protein H6934_07495 [Burkholderiaceae bacterium]|nr:hypothetical protein [Burkholderiaceae bacterium]